MKKSLIATTVATGLLAAGAVQAQPTVYGILHLSIDTFADDHYAPSNLISCIDPVTGDVDCTGQNEFIAKPGKSEMNSNTSAIGVKGSEDLGGGLKAIYKAEFRIDPFSGNPSGGSLQRRDIWVGLKGGWGKVAAGTMSSNYKQMGGKIDPLYRTVAEGRGILNMQSYYHGGAGINGGRMTQALQYTTPKMAGIEIVLNTTVSAVDAGNCTGNECDETIGAGIRWSNKNWLLFADYLDPNQASTGAFDDDCFPFCDQDESISKFGAKWSNDAFQVSGQYEAAEKQTGGNYIFLNGLWNINKSNLVTLSYGQQDKISQSFAAAYVYKFSKLTNVYVAYGTVEEDSDGSYVVKSDFRSCSSSSCRPVPGVGFKDDNLSELHKDGSVFALGIRKSF